MHVAILQGDKKWNKIIRMLLWKDKVKYIIESKQNHSIVKKKIKNFINSVIKQYRYNYFVNNTITYCDAASFRTSPGQYYLYNRQIVTVAIVFWCYCYADDDVHADDGHDPHQLCMTNCVYSCYFISYLHFPFVQVYVVVTPLTWTTYWFDVFRQDCVCVTVSTNVSSMKALVWSRSHYLSSCYSPICSLCFSFNSYTRSYCYYYQ